MGDVHTMPRKYSLAWQYEPRLISIHLGRQKYSTTSQALGELVANAFDAEANSVDISVRSNDLGVPDAMTISDNGEGITPEELANRFMAVGGVLPDSMPSRPGRFGRFGVGRLAVFRIGGYSEWVSTSAKGSERIQIRFVLRANETHKQLDIEESVLSQSAPTGTKITIHNLLDTDVLSAGRISSELLIQFCSYLLGHPAKKITVQGEVVDVSRLIISNETEHIPSSDRIPKPVEIRHLILTRSLASTRFSSQLLFSAKGRTVKSIQPDAVPTPEYLGIVECEYLDDIVTSNRESVIEIDSVFNHLQDLALQKLAEFGNRWRARHASRFIERARLEEFYPYRGVVQDSVTEVKRALYDVVLEKANESVNIEGMTKKQQAMVFKLVQRSLENQNVLEVLHEVAKLSNEDMDKFRKLLERTTLDSIIRLSSEVTSRLDFLDLLHELVYGDVSKHLKERTQLHRILEPNCWIFGPKYHLATSDKSFRSIVREHRQKAGLYSPSKKELDTIDGVDKIPDLFLAATKEYPIEPRNNHLLVEIKAPSVAIGIQERDQLRKYAQIIRDSPQFDKQSTSWDLHLVSGRVTREIQDDRKQKGKPHGMLWEWDDMRLWAFEWSEVIGVARSEMKLVREHLQRKSQDLSLSDYLRENFPDILRDLIA